MASAKLPIIVMGGAGRMGNLITRLVLADSGLELAGIVDHQTKLASLAEFNCPVADNIEVLLSKGFTGAIIDFTAPEVSLATARAAARAGAAVVIGTTGLNEGQKKELNELALNTPILWSANMSVGVNVLMKILPELTHALGPLYDMEMVEIHHRHKKDAPSGTALMLADKMAQARNWKLEDTRISCRDGVIGPRKDEELGVMAVRGGDVVGIHTAYFLGPGEIIELRHQAESRENFAQGALRAARWLAGQKPGKLWSMQDVIFGANE